MDRSSADKIILADWLGRFLGNGVLGVIFSLPAVQAIPYDPDLQSKLFIEVTPLRNIPVSVAGLVVLSVIHSWLFSVFSFSIPGRTGIQKDTLWGLTI